jgi:prevent-host-death family protein
MPNISANDLKVKGVSILESAVQEHGEAVITVRGKSKYVVMSFDTYNKLRESELDLAVKEARADYASGNYTTDTVDGHINRVID